MTSNSSNQHVTITLNTTAAFLQYLQDHPNSRRVSQAGKEDLIQWLTHSHARPSSQKEYNRRNYVQKSFSWDEKTGLLSAIAKKDKYQGREVVTEDRIADIVKLVHENNGHAGWDATWRDISRSYNGILRADVIFLLKQCQTCAKNPQKRPKGLFNAMPNTQLLDPTVLNIDDLLVDNSTSNEVIYGIHYDE